MSLSFYQFLPFVGTVYLKKELAQLLLVESFLDKTNILSFLFENFETLKTKHCIIRQK
jgi:hypothetical protein